MKTPDLNSVSTDSAIEELKAMFLASEKRHLAVEKKYQAEIKLLKEQIQVLTAKLYGKKSEKRPKDDKQLLLFEEFEDKPVISEDDDTVTVPTHKRKKRGRKPLPDNLPRIEIIHDISDEDKLCECGCQKSCCGREESEQLDIIPPEIKVYKHIRLKYACKACEGVESNKPTVMIAPLPVQVLPKSYATSGLLAYIITNKFVDALPFYRQEKIFRRHQIKIPRTTMCDWIIKVAEKCQPLIELFQQQILSGPLIGSDETTVQVHKESGRKNTTKSYIWVFRGGDPVVPCIIYLYNPSRSGDVADKFLKGYKGHVQTDGYIGYNFLDKNKEIVHLGCWAHARRKFFEASVAYKNVKTDNSKSSADEALDFIAEIYRIEKEIRESGLQKHAIIEKRQAETILVLDTFKKWLNKMEAEIVPGSYLGKALSYTQNQWEKLITFINLDVATPDNNLVENTIRPFVVGRKNWLFSDSPRGAHANATLYSIVETAKANNLEPWLYIKFILAKLPLLTSHKDYEQLLPQKVNIEMMNTFLDGVVH